jgi:hypothetical protein
MQYNRNFDFAAGTTIIADQIDQELNTLAGVINGNISTDNLAMGGVTVDKLEQSINPETRFQEGFSEGVFSGLIPNPTSGWSNRNADIVSGTAYIRGKRVQTSTQIAHTFGVSKDTYIDIDKNGNFAYQEVSNGATEPAVTANSIRVMKIVTDATKITGWYDRRPWQWIYPGQAGGPAFENSWVNYDANWIPARFRKNQMGIVEIQGLVKSGTNAAIWTLPPGFRPTPTYTQGLIFCTLAGDGLGRVDIQVNGAVYKNTIGANNSYVSLAGILFRGEA